MAEMPTDLEFRVNLTDDAFRAAAWLHCWADLCHVREVVEDGERRAVTDAEIAASCDAYAERALAAWKGARS